jgi:hypothetical protein
MVMTEAELKLFCCLDALPSPVASTNFTAFATLVEELAGDDKSGQLALGRAIVASIKDGASLSKILEDMSTHTPLYVTRG